ncbi:MAG: hypothetical protein ACJAZ3_002082 [Sphingobacteriales bacterium]|jgi:hypothetical protein
MLNESYSLRPYQHEAVERIQNALNQQSNVCVQLAAGTGKNLVIGELISRIHSRRILILTDRRVRVLQLLEFLNTNGEKRVGVFNSSKETDWAAFDTYISTIQAINKNLDSIGEYFELVIFNDVSKKRVEPIINQFKINKKLKFIQLTSDFTNHNNELFGKPVFSYSINEAISEGVLRPCEFLVGPRLQGKGLLWEKNVFEALERFKINFEKEGRKAVIICTSISEAEFLLEATNKVIPFAHSLLLHSQIPDISNKIKYFNSHKDFCIGIVVDMFSEGQFEELTDLVLLRSFKSHHMFLQAISLTTRRFIENESRRVWDYGGNRKYFSSEMGSLIEDTRPFEAPNDFVDLENLDELVDRQPIKNDATEYSETNDVDDSHDKVQEEKVVSSLVRKLANPCDDKPADEDLLGRSGLVNILKGIIERDGRKHLIIALFGRWGSGKSSVINLLKEKFKGSKHNSFIIFNAWQEEHSTNMAASLANQISKDLYQSKGFFRQLGLTLKYRLIESKWKLAIEFLLAGTLALFASLTVIPKVFEHNETTVPAYLSWFVLLIFPVAKSYWSHPFTAKVREIAKKSDFGAHLGVGHQIREQLSHLLQVFPVGFLGSLLSSKLFPLPEKHRYIVVVDDLDRCSDNKIVETLEAIQLIVDIDGVCVLLAVDHQILIDAVAARYKKQRNQLNEDDALSLAREFLGKILQLTICLDRPSESSRENFIYSRLYNKIEKTEQEELPEKESITEKIMVQKLVNDAEDSSGLFNFDSMFELEEEDVDDSEEYLADHHLEFEFFNLCAMVFEFDNPRTLIRMHNAVTLLKGLYPSITESNQTIKQYIFFVFWFEKFSSIDEVTRSRMRKEMLLESNSSEEEPMWNLFYKIGAEELDSGGRRHILYRVSNLTLPSGLELEPKSNLK